MTKLTVASILSRFLFIYALDWRQFFETSTDEIPMQIEGFDRGEGFILAPAAIKIMDTHETECANAANVTGVSFFRDFKRCR